MLLIKINFQIQVLSQKIKLMSKKYFHSDHHLIWIKLKSLKNLFKNMIQQILYNITKNLKKLVIINSNEMWMLSQLIDKLIILKLI